MTRAYIAIDPAAAPEFTPAAPFLFECLVVAVALWAGWASRAKP